MKAYPISILTIIIVIWIIDIFLWQKMKPKIQILKHIQAQIVTSAFWLIPVYFTLNYILFFLFASHQSTSETLYLLFTYNNGLCVAIYLTKPVYLLIDSIKDHVTTKKIKKGDTKTMTRAQFLGKIGTIASVIPFASIMYNISKGRFNFNIYKEDISYTNLPTGLNNLKIVQLADLHLGNYNRKYHQLDDVVKAVNAIEPDLIFITGDIVNNFASETIGWDKVFSQMKAKYGKYAVLGNHDYGDYSEWKSQEAKERNLLKIKKAITDFGFKLLLNENATLNINDEKLSIIGVENWGHHPFPQYGDLGKAMHGTLENFKILLTHDPDHWDAEVTSRTDIDLTLSGHTHGMQVGVRYKNKEWSPAKWKYKYWGGLYAKQQQYIYVNRGLGFIGIPLRIGMPPEVSYLTLKKG